MAKSKIIHETDFFLIDRNVCILKIKFFVSIIQSLFLYKQKYFINRNFIDNYVLLFFGNGTLLMRGPVGRRRTTALEMGCNDVGRLARPCAVTLKFF